MLVQCTPLAGACDSQIHILPNIKLPASGKIGAPFSTAIARLPPPAVTLTSSALAPLCACAVSILTELSVCQVFVVHGAFGGCPAVCASKSSQKTPGQPASGAPESGTPESATPASGVPESAAPLS